VKPEEKKWRKKAGTDQNSLLDLGWLKKAGEESYI